MIDMDLISIQEARTLVRSARQAQAELAGQGQAFVDGLTEALAAAAEEQAERLARLAVDETGFGKWQDKKAKNLLASLKLIAHIRAMKTVGVIEEDTDKKIIKIATPVGVIAALIPSTNPTSTTIYKAIIAIKSGNAVVFSPHPSAVNCIGATVELLREVVKKHGVSPDLIGVMRTATVEGTRELMKQSDLILATGGPDMVRAAYSSGTPALGVGPGNVPVFIERSADIASAVRKIFASKLFDNGTVCASEQAIITERVIADQVRKSLLSEGGYFLEGEKLARIKALMERPGGGMNPRIVGKTAADLALMAGIEIPPGTSLLICEEKGVGSEYPFSKEKLTALIAFYSVEEWQEACKLCYRLLKVGGMGHSLAIHSQDEKVIREFALKMPVSRILVNTPASHGAVGLTTNLAPALTLGCGSVGGSSTSDNIGPEHLFNIRRVAYGVSEAAASPQQPSPAIDIAALADLIVERLRKLDAIV
jgi:acetaldehyde dehydrogenase (acetylating)